MARPRLTYFDFPGSRGEEIRLALTIAGVAFDDNRIARADLAALKPDLPFASLPVLELPGRGAFAQSNALLRLIGRQHGFHPDDPWEAARHDALMDAAEDLRHRITPTMRMDDGPARTAARQELATGYVPQWGRCIERQIGEGPFVAGARISVADIKLYMVARWILRGGVDGIPASVFDPCPRLRALVQAVDDHPAVAAWYAPHKADAPA